MAVNRIHWGDDVQNESSEGKETSCIDKAVDKGLSSDRCNGIRE